MNEQENRVLVAALLGIAGLMLLGAIGEWPYGYYQALRWIVGAASIVGVWAFAAKAKWVWVLFFCTAGLLFNPIVPITMERETWLPFDLVAGLALLAAAYMTYLGDK
jgi:hypothetical protein